MHTSSYDSMRRCVKQHVLGDPLLGTKRPLHVLDIGGADVNGSYRSLFPFARYTSADLAADPSVDVVLDGSDDLPFADGEFDVVVSGQTFEHVGRFWKLFAEMSRVCADDGVLMVIAPSVGAIHRYPIDCYRFFPDGYQVLADDNGLLLVDSWLDPHGPFHDLVGVFRHRPIPSGRRPVTSLDYVPEIDGGLQNEAPDVDVPEYELRSGKMPAAQFLRKVQAAVDPRFYLEVGVYDGASLRTARCPSIGIDPSPRVRFELRDDQVVRTCLSADFFADESATAELGPLDLVYIDGMHLVENVYDDFINVERRAHRCSVVLVDDIYPNHPQQARRVRSSRHWTGDVWKFLRILRLARPDLILLPVDTEPTGTLVVVGVDPDSEALWSGFDLTLDEALAAPEEPTRDILTRRGALDPSDPLLWRVLRSVRELRDLDDPSDALDRLRRLVAGALPRTVVGTR